MKILVINGPNINMIGIREPNIYGKETYRDLIELINKTAKDLSIELEHYQSNHEGCIIDKIQAAYNNFDGIIINPGGYTHTSVAILDALKAVALPTVEVHISDISKRESFRQHSYISLASELTIKGHGLTGYKEAIEYLYKKYAKENKCNA